MKIAIFASAFYPSLGGVEELVRQLAHAYQRRGLEPIVITQQWPRDLPSHEVIEGIPVYRFPLRVIARNWKSRLSYALTHQKIQQQVNGLLREQKADLLHIQCVDGSAEYALRAVRSLKLPFVVSMQGELTMDANQIYQKSGRFREMLRHVLDAADAITACSGQTLAEAEQFYGKPFGERARVVYNGILLDDFKAAEPYSYRSPYLFAIGRHVKQKGFDVLLQAFAGLCQAGNTTHSLLLAGDGVEHQNLRQLASELGLAERVQFLGRVDHAQAVKLFQGSDFFVLPSRHEPMGIVNLEAMAAGKPVVATRVGGVPELVQHEVNGLLVPGEDVASMTQALQRLCDDANLRQKLGEAAFEFAQKFDWNYLASQYLDLYKIANERHR